MKFVSLYKGIILTVQGKCVKCTKLLIGFVQFLNNLSLTLRLLLIYIYQTMSLKPSLQKLTHRK